MRCRAWAHSVKKALNFAWMPAFFEVWATHRTDSGLAECSSFQACDGVAAALLENSAAKALASLSSAAISSTNPWRGKVFLRADTSLGAIFAVSRGKLAAAGSA